MRVNSKSAEHWIHFISHMYVDAKFHNFPRQEVVFPPKSSGVGPVHICGGVYTHLCFITLLTPFLKHFQIHFSYYKGGPVWQVLFSNTSKRGDKEWFLLKGGLVELHSSKEEAGGGGKTFGFVRRCNEEKRRGTCTLLPRNSWELILLWCQYKFIHLISCFFNYLRKPQQVKQFRLITVTFVHSTLCRMLAMPGTQSWR